MAFCKREMFHFTGVMLTSQTWAVYQHEASVPNDFVGRWWVFWNGAFNLTQKDNGMKQERVLGEKHSSTN